MTSNDNPLSEAVEESGDIPCVPMLWYILVRPMPPKEMSSGGIALPDEVLDAQRVQTRVCQIVGMGELAYQAETKAGLNMSKDRNRPTVGSWCLINQYAGQSFSHDGSEYRILTDTDILAVTGRPDEFRSYI